MSQHGVDGTSMRDLAAATGLNVASLYHYFPSKRELLVAVLEEHGFVDNLAAASPPALSQDPATGLADLLTDILRSMLEAARNAADRGRGPQEGAPAGMATIFGRGVITSRTVLSPNATTD